MISMEIRQTQPLLLRANILLGKQMLNTLAAWACPLQLCRVLGHWVPGELPESPWSAKASFRKPHLNHTDRFNWTKRRGLKGWKITPDSGSGTWKGQAGGRKEWLALKEGWYIYGKEKPRVRGDVGATGKVQILQSYNPIKDWGHYTKRSGKSSTEILNDRYQILVLVRSLQLCGGWM